MQTIVEVFKHQLLRKIVLKDYSNWPNVSTKFNGFIVPAKVNNFTVGYNNFQENNKLKISLFRANLKNENILF